MTELERAELELQKAQKAWNDRGWSLIRAAREEALRQGLPEPTPAFTPDQERELDELREAMQQALVKRNQIAGRMAAERQRPAIEYHHSPRERARLEALADGRRAVEPV